jgi:GT2 family glycosyltransferase
LVVIVNYRVTDLTIDCLRSLEPEVAALPESRVAVCENGTGPDAVDQLRRAIEDENWGSWASLTAIHPNRGFTGGNNVIIRAALDSSDPPDYFLLLNADTIVRSGTLRALLDFMDKRPDVGIAGSWLEYADGTSQPNAFRFFNVASELDRGLRLGLVTRLLRRWLAPPLPEHAAQTDWVSGASMLVRRQVFEAVGLLDEDLYTYFDDIDLCLRARRANWPTWYVPDSRLMHYDGRSTGVSIRDSRPERRPAYWFQARRHFLLKNYGFPYAALCDAAWITGFTVWRLRRWLQRRPDTDPPHLLWDAVRHSVLMTGSRRRPVQNPALTPSPARDTAGRQSAST